MVAKTVSEVAPAGPAQGDTWSKPSTGEAFRYLSGFWEPIANTTALAKYALVAGATYNVDASDVLIGVNRAGAVAITLPTAQVVAGRRVIVKVFWGKVAGAAPPPAATATGRPLLST